MACGETVCTRGERRAPFIGVGGAEGLHERHLEGRAGEFKARCTAADLHSRHRRHWRAGVWPERRKMATHEEEHVPWGISLGRRAGRDDGASSAQPTGWGTRTPMGGQRYASYRVVQRARAREPERPLPPNHFKKTLFQPEFLKNLNSNLEKCRYQSCRGAKHLQLLQMVVGVLWLGSTGNDMQRCRFSWRGQRIDHCVDTVFGGFPLRI
jgi:hypothetical protein